MSLRGHRNSVHKNGEQLNVLSLSKIRNKASLLSVVNIALDVLASIIGRQIGK
jgi:hypothetical protein